MADRSFQGGTGIRIKDLGSIFLFRGPLVGLTHYVIRHHVQIRQFCDPIKLGHTVILSASAPSTLDLFGARMYLYAAEATHLQLHLMYRQLGVPVVITPAHIFVAGYSSFINLIMAHWWY
jgi:hypothetical protein